MFKKVLTLLCALMFIGAAHAQSIWSDVPDSGIPAAGERRIQPSVNEWLTDTAWIRNRLRQEILNQGISVERGDEIELARDPLIGRAIDLIRTGKVK